MACEDCTALFLAVRLAKDREIWLDALREVKVAQVVLHHCRLAITAKLKDAGTHFHHLIDNIHDMIGLVRIPALLICSGIVFSAPPQGVAEVGSSGGGLAGRCGSFWSGVGSRSACRFIRGWVATCRRG
ncbi:hypothetical protein [Paracoccus beibuensis]|uniref:hypothetical protein n=1 Tax=Paracoccus beibuensis TaxID=547602 RepID=UPI00223F9436|nr:hypothetical protein [Paracoccus beibuensis]